MFDLVAPYAPAGDQPAAIDQLVAGLESGEDRQCLLGITGSGKTFTMAHVIQRVQRPTLIIAHNKTLAAQLANELKGFFPRNAVEYFVSYYDFYQPEAYLPQSDVYIEKSAAINDEIDRLRHSATRSLLERRDVIVVASVSCIYGLGVPEAYLKAAITIKVGETTDLGGLLRRLVDLQYERNDVAPLRGQFRLRGDVLEIHAAYEEDLLRVEWWGDEIERITRVDPVTGEVLDLLAASTLYPAKHFITSEDRLELACVAIEDELAERLDELRANGKLLEAQRLEQRTRYDLEMLREVGYCNGIENYSRHLTGRSPGEPPATLLSYFPDDFVVMIDESHVTLPQIRGMYHGDRARKDVLVDHGFRLPSARDNRPLTNAEFWERVGQVLFVSATPGDEELETSKRLVEQIIRPTGLVDPEILVRPSEGQIDDLIGEIKTRVARQERALVTTLTKRMAEDLTDYLSESGIKVRYLHSDIKAIERVEILRDLRLGRFDVVVGVNLLREGLDLPEVSLVCILDADKEGFLRAERSLIQTIGRAARHTAGQVIMYADTLTASMDKAISETERRRSLQMAHNLRHGITPQRVAKSLHNHLLEQLQGAEQAAKRAVLREKEVPAKERKAHLQVLEKAMREAAERLDFEEAALIRDRIRQLRQPDG